MKSTITLLFSALLAITLLAVSDQAEAKRMGFGKSFGGSSKYSQPYQRNTSPSNSTSTASAPKAAPQSASPKRSGLMGMLGGLAMGGLLGALLFGGGFENINFFDIIIFAVIAFVLYKLFSARRPRPAMAMGGGGTGGSGAESAPTMQRENQFNTDVMFGSGGSGAAPGAAAPMPADFDAGVFLDGAQAAYRRLQAAWDSGDLADIRQFTSDAVFAEVQGQLHERQGENRTEILKLEAELLEVREFDGELQATVLFDSLLREEADAQPAQVREVWHFVKPKGALAPTWYLDGIQQMAD